MIASRWLASPTGPSTKTPAWSGPRWASAAPMAPSSPASTGAAPSRTWIPAMPHMLDPVPAPAPQPCSRRALE